MEKEVSSQKLGGGGSQAQDQQDTAQCVGVWPVQWDRPGGSPASTVQVAMEKPGPMLFASCHG